LRTFKRTTERSIDDSGDDDNDDRDNDDNTNDDCDNDAAELLNATIERSDRLCLSRLTAVLNSVACPRRCCSFASTPPTYIHAVASPRPGQPLLASLHQLRRDELLFTGPYQYENYSDDRCGRPCMRWPSTSRLLRYVGQLVVVQFQIVDAQSVQLRRNTPCNASHRHTHTHACMSC